MNNSWQHSIGAVPSTLYQVMKFPSPDGKAIMELHSDQVEAVREYFAISESTRVTNLNKQTLTDELDKPDESRIVIKKINIGTNEKPKFVTLGFDTNEASTSYVISFFKNNKKTIVSEYIDMPGINPTIAKHEQKVDPSARPIKRRPRK